MNSETVEELEHLVSMLYCRCYAEEADRSKQGNLCFSHIVCSPVDSVMAVL